MRGPTRWQAHRAPSRTARSCHCGHPRDAHQHYRRGSECALCPDGGCDRFRGRRGPLAALAPALARLARRR